MAPNFADEWAANEARLAREGSSLGELLARLQGFFSSLALAPQEWEGLLECAHTLPPTLAGFPLWVGFPIDASPPGALLDVSLLGGTRAAAFFEDQAGCADNGPAPARIAALLGKTGVAGSPLQRIVGNRLLLEYQANAPQRALSDPGFLLYPVRPTLAGAPCAQRLEDFQVALNAVAGAMHRDPDEAGAHHATRAYLALEPDTRIGAIGVPPANGRLLRLSMLGFTDTRAVATLLERVGWPGPHAAVVAVLERLATRGALAQLQLGLRLDLSATGLEPTLELQVFSANTIYDDTGWFKDQTCWTALIDALRAQRLAVPEKLSGLTSWSSARAQTLMGRSGLFLLLRRIHHFAIAFNAAGDRQVNAHVFLLMTRWPGG
ncbi:MAG: hypothetical protein OXE97_07290 [Gammaproteobacteria bacterium]|nr:hypothetical protein [Gammaproteobacteria bacterium]MCY4281982.1 hypothetical protein [Gammaproteobacteria bacterium]